MNNFKEDNNGLNNPNNNLNLNQCNNHSKLSNMFKKKKKKRNNNNNKIIQMNRNHNKIMTKKMITMIIYFPDYFGFILNN
jgi:hypothetical protein